MRGVWLGFAVLALAACDSAQSPAPPEPVPVEIDADLVTVRVDGLTAGAEAFYFAAGQTEVEAALARTLGKPGDTGAMPECGAGPMEFASYSGGLTVNFQNGSLVGWNWTGGTAAIVFSDAIGIGTAKSEVEAMPGFTMIEGSTLGEEFALSEEGAFGFFEDGKVSMLYAGTQCFFR